MAFLKPQSPLIKGNDYFYPLTTADQVIMDGGYRLDQIVGKVEKSTVTLYQNRWSAAAPYSYSIVVNGLTDDLNMQVFPHYSEDFAEKQALKEEFAKVSFCSRQGNIVTFECWDEVPSVDIDVDIEINVMYPIEMALKEEIEARLPKLNYSIVGGTTEPSNPTENMIWVNTDQPITDYVFSKNEPQNPIEGMMWLIIGDYSDVAFHELIINNKKSGEIYPDSSKQYISGIWVNKNAKSYKNNKWINWYDGELYYNGDEYTDITGGWQAYAHQYSSAASSATLKPKIEKQNDGSMKITYYPTPATSGAGGGVVRTINKIDLSKYSKLEFTGYLYSTGGSTYVRLLVWSAIGTYQDTNLVASLQGSSSKTVKTQTLDVSKLSGDYYIGFGIYENTAGAEIYIQSLKRQE